MKKLLAFSIVTLMAGSALAAPGIGIFFSDTEFTEEYTNTVTAPAPFNAYVVVMDVDFPAISAYEVGIEISDAGVIVTNATGPNNWQNFGGTFLNHRCGYGPGGVQITDGSAVVSTLTLFYIGADPVEIRLGPSTPSSNETGHPQIIEVGFPDVKIQCGLTTGVHIADTFQTVATLNNADNGLVATEAQSLSHIKALFD